MKKAVLCDVDGVLVRGQTQKLLLFYLSRLKKVPFAVFFQVYFWFFLYKLHLVRDVVTIRQQAFKVFKGWPVEGTRTLFLSFFLEEIKGRLNSSLVKKLGVLAGEGYEVVLVSASLEEIVRPIADHLGIRHVIATRLESQDGMYTGRMTGTLPYGAGKFDLADAFLRENGLSWEGSWVFTDHHSDLPLLERATYPVAVDPDPVLRTMALKKSWMIHDL